MDIPARNKAVNMLFMRMMLKKIFRNERINKEIVHDICFFNTHFFLPTYEFFYILAHRMIYILYIIVFLEFFE